jgi:hypothetical protein
MAYKVVFHSTITKHVGLHLLFQNRPISIVPFLLRIRRPNYVPHRPAGYVETPAKMNINRSNLSILV